jgi:hypothetical protein
MIEKQEPSFYDQLNSIDVIDPILEAFMQGRVDAKIDGKLALHRQMALNRKWTFAAMCKDRKCAKWLGIYAVFYKILPPPCLQCWKVVFAPATVVELIETQKFQEELGLPAKCGIEARDYTSGLGGYRAFWYCPFYAGLDGARAHFGRIKNALIKFFGEPLVLERIDQGKLFLKRGCTELERDFGPSDQWDEIDHSGKFKLLETVWEDPEEMTKEWPPLIYTNFKRWIEWAIAHGDQTARQYVNNRTLGVPAVKYHNSGHKAEDFKQYYPNPLNGIGEGNDGNEGIEEGAGGETNLLGLES